MKYHVQLTAETVKKYRRHKGLTRSDFARMVSMSDNYIYKLEADMIPLTDAAEQTIRRKLDLTDEELVKFNVLAAELEK
ncbi:helix-turn-helix domain-containing protein [Aquibacillus albus]|uniref:Transcriptional regulator with XRE-family HTH domain n=1 Tax=Aquibacillus albus TaxID=1168171 RepID=A0ABS2N6B8_9BACI|nr:helix-turn-helix transcriptional regulator [Aquibacillus albus]MBM7573634.1 transcriptional regulator with XRE-family HTH domain [Aquibacillus albus]